MKIRLDGTQLEQIYFERDPISNVLSIVTHKGKFKSSVSKFFYTSIFDFLFCVQKIKKLFLVLIFKERQCNLETNLQKVNPSSKRPWAFYDPVSGISLTTFERNEHLSCFLILTDLYWSILISFVSGIFGPSAIWSLVENSEMVKFNKNKILFKILNFVLLSLPDRLYQKILFWKSTLNEKSRTMCVDLMRKLN